MQVNKTKVAFIGLGVMGFSMAGHLQHNGYPTRVYNRTTRKAETWCDTYSGTYGITPAEAVADADIVFLCVGNDDDVRSVVYGDIGVLANMKKAVRWSIIPLPLPSWHLSWHKYANAKA